MADRITLEVATPSRLVIGEQGDEALVAGIECYFCSLPGPAPLLTTLGHGALAARIGPDGVHAPGGGAPSPPASPRSSRSCSARAPPPVPTRSSSPPAGRTTSSTRPWTATTPSSTGSSTPARRPRWTR